MHALQDVREQLCLLCAAEAAAFTCRKDDRCDH